MRGDEFESYAVQRVRDCIVMFEDIYTDMGRSGSVYDTDEHTAYVGGRMEQIRFCIDTLKMLVTELEARKDR